MAEFLPTQVDRPSHRSWLPTLGSVALFVLALVIVKPWGPAATPLPTTAPTIQSRASPVVATPRFDRTAYDPRLFGSREPDPAWELWPAGYVVEFGISGPLPVHSPGPSGAASQAPLRSDPAPSPSKVEPPGERVVDLGPADHLIALGINTPADVRVVDLRLWILRVRCCDAALAYVRLPTLWESSHFIVVGVEDPDRPGTPGPWPVGEFRLDLVLQTGEVRSIRFRVTAPLG